MSTVHEKGTSGQTRAPVEQQLEENGNYGEAEHFRSDDVHPLIAITSTTCRHKDGCLCPSATHVQAGPATGPKCPWQYDFS